MEKGRRHLKKARCKVCKMVVCKGPYPAQQMSNHVVGRKHKAMVEQSNLISKLKLLETSDTVPRLQEFIDLEDVGLIGLEYVIEHWTAEIFKYECTLCEEHLEMVHMMLHLIGERHRTLYLIKHHPSVSRSEKNTPSIVHLTNIALAIEQKFGRKRIQRAHGDGCPSGYSQPQSSLHRDSVTEGGSADNEFADEFRENAAFLDYKTFEIKNDDDASFISKITRNFTKALVKYREECKKEVCSTPADSTVEEPINVSAADRDVSSSSAFPTNVMHEIPLSATPNAAPHIPVSKNEATELFFKSIKNMDSSEVVNIFQRVAATNPSFSGIDIPSLMTFLRVNGRLKRP
ncbi:uncharacterized protein LOC142487220 isoform X2 [Ascaphus truei]|uniref:uncharacterized protein LOC142487220 isoform X2 n=1 Tax=Ascaphus truei TaxID=8439 RepID=UPI003F5A69AC